MRSILSHCKEVKFSITGLSNRPIDIEHGVIKEKEQDLQDCILAFVTVEKGDTLEKAPMLASEVLKFSKDVGHTNVFLCPFGHLSKNLASSKDSHAFFEAAAKEIDSAGLKVVEGHFGSDKEYLIHVYGHRGNTRYREF